MENWRKLSQNYHQILLLNKSSVYNVYVISICSALEREHGLTLKLRQSLEAEKSQQEATGRERALIEDLQIQLETERGKVHDLNNALQREQRSIKEVLSSAEAEKRMLQEHLDQEREVNHHLKHDLDSMQVRILTLTMLWADLADDKLVIFFLFLLENRI